MKLKYRVIERFRSKYSLKVMCYFFEVSRSGYYTWYKRQGGENRHTWLRDLICECQNETKQTHGCRRVRRRLMRKNRENVSMKAVLGIMCRYDLLTRVRRVRLYTHFGNAVHKYPNFLKRVFDQSVPNKFWVTDITYVPTAKGCYTCAL